MGTDAWASLCEIVEQLNLKPALLSRISYEVVDQVWGVSQETIQAWWIEAEVPKLIDEAAKVGRQQTRDVQAISTRRMVKTMYLRSNRDFETRPASWSKTEG
jgi:hypothetical protein